MQIVHCSRRGSRDIEHFGSAHDEVELEVLKAAARQRLVEGQGVLDFDLDVVGESGPLEIVSSRMGHLWDALCRVPGWTTQIDITSSTLRPPLGERPRSPKRTPVQRAPLAHQPTERATPFEPEAQKAWPSITPAFVTPTPAFVSYPAPIFVSRNICRHGCSALCS